MTEPPLSNCWPLSPCVVAPVFLADVPAGGAWNEILEACGDWIARPVPAGDLERWIGEGYAWMILIALISPAFAVSIILLLLKPGARSRRRARRRLS